MRRSRARPGRHPQGRDRLHRAGPGRYGKDGFGPQKPRWIVIPRANGFGRRLPSWDTTAPIAARMQVAGSLALWLMVAAAGRLIRYL
jgi:hypothetical protein